MAYESTVQTLRIIFVSSLMFTLTVHYLIYTKICATNNLTKIWVPNPVAFLWLGFPFNFLRSIGFMRPRPVRVISLFVYNMLL